MATFDKVRLDGKVIPVGVAIDAGAFASESGAPPTGLVSTANWSNDVRHTFVTGSYYSHAIGVQDTEALRSCIRFPVASFQVGLTLASVKLAIQCNWASGNSADRYVLSPYNGNGLGNPPADTGQDIWNRSGSLVDYYLYGDAQLTATGALVFELGAQAVADLSAAIAAAETYFSIGLRQIGEALGSYHYSTFEGFTTGTPPTLTVSETSPSPGPSVTSVGDGTIADTDTLVPLFGAALGANQSNGHLDLNTAANGSGTAVVQTIQSWSATAIVFNVVRGALSNGTVYAIVYTNDGLKSSGYSVTLETGAQPPPPDPVITGLSTSTLTNGKTGVVITGTDFGATQGAGYVELNTAADGSGTSQTQTITAWGDTSITFTVARGSLPYGRLYLLVHSDV